MTTNSNPEVALELAELRRLIDVGFAEANGKLNLLVASDEHTSAALTALQHRVDEADQRITALEKAKWLAMGAGVVLGGGAGGVVQLIGG